MHYVTNSLKYLGVDGNQSTLLTTCSYALEIPKSLAIFDGRLGYDYFPSWMSQCEALTVCTQKSALIDANIIEFWLGQIEFAIRSLI